MDGTTGDPAQPRRFASVEACADALIEHLGHDLRVALPLGLGKPVEFVNALYRRAKRDPSLKLTLLTALTLEVPQPQPGLEHAFLQPILDRVYKGCPELEYASDQRQGRLPQNVRVVEFYFRPGSMLGNPTAQQDYVCTNYTTGARDIFLQGCNVCAQMVSRRQTPGEGERFSLSCNPDTGPALCELLRTAQARGERRVAVIAVINDQLPYMVNDAEVAPETFDWVVDHPDYSTPLFSTPKQAVTVEDYAIGIHAAALLRDGGTLQVGIGSLGDALIHAAILRHQQSAQFKALLSENGCLQKNQNLIDAEGGTGAFQEGLYGASEMFVDGFMHLHRAGVLRRKVYDFWPLQHLINERRCDPANLAPELLDELRTLGVNAIGPREFAVLQHHGVFTDETRYESGAIITSSGERLPANLGDPRVRQVLGEHCLGQQLRRGIFMHGGFFLGPTDFYQRLRELDDEVNASICMTGVDRVNQLALASELYSRQRIHGRFINTGMMATLFGAVVSDGLEDGRVVSGVGGQYNFVAMAHQIPTARSILMIRAIRQRGPKPSDTSSNIVFNYGHTTIPRHLRDIVITEYGIADLRGKTDAEVVKAMLNIADSRFQVPLLEQAKAAGKVERAYQIPDEHRYNSPSKVRSWLQHARDRGLLPAFPLGTDLNPTEVRIAAALKTVKGRVASTPKWKLMLQAARTPSVSQETQAILERLNLGRAKGIRERIARDQIIRALKEPEDF